MKALLYKEFKLAMHPICYVFMFAFPFMILIPSYPIGIGFIYILSCYPILFLGANKGQQSNDLLYSTLLPIRKKDIVKARIFTVLVMQVIFIILMSALSPLSALVQQNLNAQAAATGAKVDQIPGLPISGFVSVLAFGIVGFAVADIIFFPIYYKNGRSIVLSTILMILGFAVYILIFTVVIPYIPIIGEPYKNFLCDSGLGIQFGLLGGAIVVSALLHYLIYKISSERLEKVDF